MGINISGIASSIAAIELKQITDLLKIEISETFEERVFEEALSNNMADDDMYFTPTTKGCLITAGDKFSVLDLKMRQLTANNHKLLKFIIGETSTFYFFEYIENEKVLRRKLSIDYEVKLEKGKSLELEFLGMEDDELIDQLIEMSCGNSIFSIEPDTISYKYKFLGITSNLKPPNPNNLKTIKPWWKLW